MIPDSVAVLALMGLMAALYGCLYLRGMIAQAREDGYVQGWTDATFKHIAALLPNDPYDWKVQGL